MTMNPRNLAEILERKLSEEELDALVNILTDRHQLLLHALGTYRQPAIPRTITPKRIAR